MNKKIMFFILTLACGAAALAPFLDFQFYLSQGDHGRELYAFQKMAEGTPPFREFSWLYGPLMPVYFAAFFKIFGTSIQTALLAQYFLILGVGAVIYLICATFMTPLFSLIAALWYWAFRGVDFFHSYQHVGGLLLIMSAMLCVFKYLEKQKESSIYMGMTLLFFLGLVRLNMAGVLCAGFLMAIFLIDCDQKNKHIAGNSLRNISLAVIAVGSAIFLYWFLLRGLPDYALHQSLPYASQNRAESSGSILLSFLLLSDLMVRTFTLSWKAEILAVLLSVSAIQWIYQGLKGRLTSEETKKSGTIFIILFLFIVMTLHEFIISRTYFRLNWSYPIIYILVIYMLFLLIEMNKQRFHTNAIRYLSILLLLTVIIFRINANHTYIHAIKNPQHMVKIGPNRIFTTQSPDWFYTVHATVRVIQNETKPDEKIFAIPHSALYYFLSQRDAGARQLDFFEHNQIPEEQEKETIAQLEKNKVNYVVVSNRVNSVEPGMGQFGRTHCRLIDRYLRENFEVIHEIGPFQHPNPGWAWNHGTRILRRKE